MEAAEQLYETREKERETLSSEFDLVYLLSILKINKLLKVTL